MCDDLKNAYKGKKVLVTGHTGFKGGWLSLWLAELGAKVIGYSLKSPTRPNFFKAVNLGKKITHILGDIRDQKGLVSLFKKHSPEFVFHMAAQSLVRVSYDEPHLTYETNAMGTVNLLEAARITKCARVLIVATSDKCYENKEKRYRYRETDILGGYDPYSSSKACAEFITATYRSSFFSPTDYGKKHTLALSSVRAGNIIGGGDWAKDRIIPDCIRALSKAETVSVRNPKSVRPWQYILEPVSGYLLLGSLMNAEGARYCGAWNFGPNEENVITVEEMVKLVLKHWGRGSYKTDNSPHPHEAVLLDLDINKAGAELNWRPRYNIREMIERTVKWYKRFYGNASSDELRKFTVNEIAEYANSRDMSRKDANTRGVNSKI